LSSAISLCLIALNYLSNSYDANRDTPINSNQKGSVSTTFWFTIIMVMLTFPVLSVFITQILRGIWFLPDYDSPARFLLALPIFYIVFKNGLNPIRYWQITIAFSVLLTFIVLPWIPKYYGLDDVSNSIRLGTYFVDPLTFGYLALTFGLLLFFSINLFGKDKWYFILFKLICATIAFYLSIKSGSRTGWFAIPFCFFLLIYVHGPKNKSLSTFIALTLTLVITAAFYFSSSTIQNRVADAINDLDSYKLNKVNPDTSVGDRLSFARMGWYFFKLKPIVGWGHDGFKNHVNDVEITKYAVESTRIQPIAELYHNEFTTNMVAFGIFGIIYTCLIFFVPLALFITSWRNGKNVGLCAFGIAFVICELVSSMSTEVTALKFTASYYAVVISCLCACVLHGMAEINSTGLESSQKA
jgi:O-antigen ligase